jgi:hypothetical protein
MISAFLAVSGSPVLIPDAVNLVSGPKENEVSFVDAEGRTLVVFQRADLVIYSNDGAGLIAAMESEPALPDAT